MRTDEEIKFRVAREDKELLVLAAQVENVTLTEFLRQPALERAHQVVEASKVRQVTLLSPVEYDEMMAALEMTEDEVGSRFELARVRLEQIELD